MRVIEITDVSRNDTPLYYRRAYNGVAVLEQTGSATVSKRVHFVLEHSPIGPVSISVKLLEDLDYPALPAIKALKEHIQALEDSGRLP